jgi:GNAT superfamily N-acetyltransferase
MTILPTATQVAGIEIEPNGIRYAMCRFVDWPHLDDLIRDCFPHFSSSEVAYFVRANARFSCLAWLGDRPVGYWMHSGDKGPMTGWVEQVGVARAYRSKGLGRCLILNYLQFASWVGFERVGGSVLKTNAASLATFRALGFETSPDITDDRLKVFHALDSKHCGDWPAATTVAGVESDSTAARDRFRHPPLRSIAYRVVGRIATTLISLAR